MQLLRNLFHIKGKPLVWISLLLTYGHVQAQLDSSSIRSFSLSNGLQFIVHEDASIPNVSMYLFYRVGSRNEYQGITGLAHFFEHMMFNGARKYGPKQFDQVMEFNGGANNAYTTSDMTVYTNWFPASALPVMFDLEADRMRSLQIDSGIVESERGVVLSERSTSLENSPWTILTQSVDAQAFMEHPYHWPVIGYEADIRNWNKQDLETFYRSYYAPNNCVIVLTGAVKTDSIRQLAEKYMSDLKAQPPPTPVHAIEPRQEGQRRILIQKDVQTPYLYMGFKTPEASHPDYYPLSLLSTILSGGKSSLFHRKLIDSLELANEVSTYFGQQIDPYLFQVFATLASGQSLDTLEKKLIQCIQELGKSGPSDADLEKAKTLRRLQFYRMMETIDGKADLIGRFQLYTGSYKNLFDVETSYNKITRSDIQRVIQTYLQPSNATIGILQPIQPNK